MPRFSIVIPTLQRSDTFRHALATARAQTFGDFEIVVQNNGRDLETEAIVDECNDPQIRYFWSNAILTMPENWERALSNAKGEYVFFLGDDDGLYPDACALADHALRETSCLIVSWIVGASYYWPGYLHADLNNLLVGGFDRGTRIEIIGSESELKNLFAFVIDYSRLPMIYNSFVHRSVVERARASTGRYFIGHAPDVVSGIVNAAVTDSFARIVPPLSVTGTSGHSTGHRMFSSASSDAISERRDFGRFEYDEALVDARNLQVFIANDMLTAQREVFPDRAIALSYKGLVSRLAAAINDRPGFYRKTLRAIVELAKRHRIDLGDIAIPAEMTKRPVPKCGVWSNERRIDFVIDGNEAEVFDIEQAVKHLGRLRPAVDAVRGPAVVMAATNHPLVANGDVLAFGTGKNGTPALKDGWGEPEAWGTWSVMKQAHLAFRFKSVPSNGIHATLHYRAFLTPEHNELTVTCLANGHSIGLWKLNHDHPNGEMPLLIPRFAFGEDGELILRLTVSEPQSPALLGLSTDRRLLGIGIQQIKFEAAA